MANVIKIGGASGSTPTLITKNITSNGVYNASDDGADGYSSVDVSVSGGGGIDYIESWIITNTSTTMSVHTEYIGNNISSYAVYSQGGNVTHTEGDMAIRIGSDTGWKWQATALDDMTYKIYDVVNETLSELRTATNGTVVLSNIDITGNLAYEIRRYS